MDKKWIVTFYSKFYSKEEIIILHSITTAIGRPESAGGSKHNSPSIRTLERYAAALGY